MKLSLLLPSRLLWLLLQLSSAVKSSQWRSNQQLRGRGLFSNSSSASNFSLRRLNVTNATFKQALARNQTSEPTTIFLTGPDLAGFKLKQVSTVKPCLARSRNASTVPRRRQHQSCAVVGPSPNTKGTHLASRINGHEAVFRVGICEREDISKYQQDIGNKSTYCVSWQNQQLGDMPNGTRLIVPFKSTKYLIPAFPGCETKALIISPKFFKMWDDKLDSLASEKPASARPTSFYRKWAELQDSDCVARAAIVNRGGLMVPEECKPMIGLSTGFIGVLVAMDLCQTVDVYGFDTDEDPNAPYGHVHNAIGAVAGPCTVSNHGHPFSLERNILKKFEKRGQLKLDPSTKVRASLGEHSAGC